MTKPNIKSYVTGIEKDNREKMLSLFKSCPIPHEEILSHLGLFIRRQDLSRLLFMNELYQKIVPIHGCVMEFGVRWGQDIALYESFRGLYEPFNNNRRFIGFDTFEGFPSVHEKDGGSEIIHEGAFNVTEKYEEYLTEILDCHEIENPIPNITKYELVKGNAIEQIENYLNAHPETIIAFAYFDFDIYEPTVKCLEAIKPHLTKGAVIGFDEINVQDYPGETLALKEVLGLDTFKIQRSPYSSVQSYLIYE